MGQVYLSIQYNSTQPIYCYDIVQCLFLEIYHCVVNLNNALCVSQGYTNQTICIMRRV